MSTGTITATRRGSQKRQGSQEHGAIQAPNEESPHETADDSGLPREVDLLKPDVPAEQPCCCCIAAAVRSRWSSSGYAALKRVECRCEDGVLLIRGTVTSFYHKQMAQELARCVDGVKHIVNELEVSPLCNTSKNEHDNEEG
ncbi:BON domain-containing protein [Rhodopirellula europaea]|uniref:BON domain-containing protein n=1 Tax=Rhodopirellula europaea TaxID=1263866 RepID=UPI003D2DC68B